MSTEIKVPQLPESVTDATIVAWHKNPGDVVQQDDVLVDLETDKVVLEVVAPATGRLMNISKEKDSVVKEGELLGLLEAGAIVAEATSGDVADVPAKAPLENNIDLQSDEPRGFARLFSGPASRRAAKSNNVIPKNEEKENNLEQVQKTTSVAKNEKVTITHAAIERVPMPRLRAKIAERLLMAQQNAAILTTFNEVNLQAVTDVRKQYKEIFEKKYGVKLGLMSFFIKAAVEALKEHPIINAAVEGNDILYHHYYDIGVAVSTERGLVVPVIRNADHLNFSDIESTIIDYSNRARKGQISLDELTGGTFTITNGGIFGSLLSTPILNPPQSAILGMHKIEKRAVVENDQIVSRPMMHLALSYDHRIIDGKDSVQFLVAIKNFLEDPTRLLLHI